MKKHERKKVTGFDVWQWPEFRAFAERLGIDWEAPVKSLTITMEEPMAGVLVMVDVKHMAVDMQSEPKAINTTNAHTKDYETWRAPSDVQPDHIVEAAK